MTNEERDIQRKLRVLQHAEKIGNARKACRYFGVGRSSFYRWRNAYRKHGEAGLKNAKSIPKNPANQTPVEIVDKVLYLRRKYHLGLSGSSGIWRAITTSKSRMPGFTVFSSAMVSIDCPEVHARGSFTPSDIRSRFRGIISKWTSSS